MCARFIYANTVTQDTQNAPPALRASPGSNRSKQRPGHCVPREPRPRCAYVCACVHTHMCLSIGHVSLSQFSERLSRAGTRRISLKNTAAERQGIAIGVSVREQTAERLQREQTIYALLYRGRAALTPLGPIPLEALEERGPRVCAALLAAHRARRLARAGGDALGVARHHRVELLGGASE